MLISSIYHCKLGVSLLCLHRIQEEVKGVKHNETLPLEKERPINLRNHRQSQGGGGGNHEPHPPFLYIHNISHLNKADHRADRVDTRDRYKVEEVLLASHDGSEDCQYNYGVDSLLHYMEGHQRARS